MPIGPPATMHHVAGTAHIPSRTSAPWRRAVACSVPIIGAGAACTFAAPLVSGAWAVALVACAVCCKGVVLVVWWRALMDLFEDPRLPATPTSEETTALIARLHEESSRLGGHPDALARRANLVREAWAVADRARDADTPRAVECALALQAQAGEGLAMRGTGGAPRGGT